MLTSERGAQETTPTVESNEPPETDLGWLERIEVASEQEIEPDGTLLRIRVLTPTGAEASEGYLEWEETLSLGLVEPWNVPVQRLPIVGTPTELWLGAEILGVALVASHPGYRSGVRHVSGLRRKDGKHRPNGRLIHEIEIALDAAPPQPWIEGEIRVDGVLQAPPGIRIQPRLSAGDLLASAEARIDVSNSSYWVGPLPAGGVALLVTSEMTAPMWLELPGLEGRRSARMDLDLSRGRTLELRALDGSTQLPAPRCRLYVDVAIPTWKSGRRQGFGGQASCLTTDESGLCQLGWIPPQGRLTVAACPQARETSQGYAFEPGTVLLDLDLATVAEDSFRIDVPVYAPEPPQARFWGPAPRAELFGCSGSEELRVAGQATRNGAPTQLESRASASGGWEVSTPAPAKVRLWLECARRRVSDVAAFDVLEAETLGPLVFGALDAREVVLAWRGARVGERMTVRAVQGDFDERLAEFELTQESGEHTLKLSGPCTLQVAALDASGDVDQRVVSVDPATDRRVQVDWRGATQATLRARLDGVVFEGDATVLLAHLGSYDALVSEAQLVRFSRGAAALRSPLAAGDYFFRIDGARDDALVCGILSLPDRDDAHVTWIEWSSEDVVLASPSRIAQLDSIDDHPLPANLPVRWRQFQLGRSDPNSRADGPRRVSLPRDSRWSALP